MTLETLLKMLREYGTHEFSGNTDDVGPVKLVLYSAALTPMYESQSGALASEYKRQNVALQSVPLSPEFAEKPADPRRESAIDAALNLTSNPGQLYPEGNNE